MKNFLGKLLIFQVAFLGPVLYSAKAENSNPEDQNFYLSLVPKADKPNKDTETLIFVRAGKTTLSPFLNQTNLGIGFEAEQFRMVKLGLETSFSFAEETHELDKVDETVNVQVNKPEFSLYSIIGISPLQLLTNAWFADSTLPINFRVSLLTGFQTFQNKPAVLIAGGRYEAMYEFQNVMQLGLGVKNTFEITGKDADREVRFDVEFTIGRRF